MNLPPPDHRCWLSLVSGRAPQFQTRQLGLQLLFKRIQDPKFTVAAKVGEVRAFFEKYTPILASEIAQLEKL